MLMRETRASLPLIFLIAATRGMAGVGLGFLLADRLKRKRRQEVGRVLLGIGALSTIPLMVTMFRKSSHHNGVPTVANVPQSGVDPSEGLRAD
jgi:hypothetical protein